MLIFYCPKRPKGKRFRVAMVTEAPSKYARVIPWERIQRVARMLGIENIATRSGEQVAEMLNSWSRNPWFDSLKRWFATVKSRTLRGVILGAVAIAVAVYLVLTGTGP
jgi:diphthamide synthase (EF-2-diphthine--ammonia ligase)